MENLKFSTAKFSEISEWSREEIISWLQWNDRHGEYSDEEAELYGWDPLSKEEALKIVEHQLSMSTVEVTFRSPMPPSELQSMLEKVFWDSDYFDADGAEWDIQ
jgi:hypothetical protein